MPVGADQLDLVPSELEAAGTKTRQLSIKAGGVTEAKLGFSWKTVEVLASAFAYGSPRSTYTLATAASSNANVLDNAELLRNGVGGLDRVTTTAAAGEWSISGTTLSIHGDITASGDTYQLRYVIGTASGASASGNLIWLSTVPQVPLHASSDYFQDSTLDPKWSEWDPQAALTVAETSEGLVLTRAANAALFDGVIAEVPAATTYAITAEIELNATSGKLTSVGLVVGKDLVTNPTTDPLWALTVLWSTTHSDWVVDFTRWSNYNAGAAAKFTDRVGIDATRILLRIFVDTAGGTMEALASRDGKRWLSLGGAQAYTTDTPTYMGFITRNPSGDDTTLYSRMFRVDVTTDPYLPVGGYVGTSVASTFPTPRDVTVAPNSTVDLYGWHDRKVKLIKCEAFCTTVATVGAYTMAVHKDPNVTNVNMLSAATFDLTGLSAYTPGDVPLTTTADDLILEPGDVWEVSFTSDNVGLDAAGVYFQLTWLVL